MTPEQRKKLARLQTEMDKRYTNLRMKLPYGLQWLTQSAGLYEWYEKRKKLIKQKV